MRFTPTGPDTSIEQTKARLAKYQEHQSAHGFSRWIDLQSLRPTLSQIIGGASCDAVPMVPVLRRVRLI
jgi:hypothetical protein